MKKLVLIAVFATLIGGTVFAQQDDGKAATAAATDITGVLESIDSSSLTLRDDANQLVTLRIVVGTLGAKRYEVGTRVRVKFHRDGEAVSIADSIQGAVDESPAVATTPYARTTATYADSTSNVAASGEVAVNTPEPDLVPEQGTGSTSNMEASLPHTASPLAAVGLLGLLSFGAALVVRFTH